MSVSLEYLERCAGETGFQVASLEKVTRLGELAGDIARHAFLAEVLALKGGTALNLAFGAPSRLSVDLDFNYKKACSIRTCASGFLTTSRTSTAIRKTPSVSPKSMNTQQYDICIRKLEATGAGTPAGRLMRAHDAFVRPLIPGNSAG